MREQTILIIVLVGVLLRAVFFIISPPSNSYDDHFEAVSLQRSEQGTFTRAHPSACWQCYQPPAYYVVGNTLLNLLGDNMSNASRWKVVQSISFVASSISLILCLLALANLRRPEKDLLLYLTVALCIAVLPRLLYTAAMPTNDAMLEMWVSLAVFGYVLYFKDNQGFGKGFGLVLCATLGAALTKQSGLVLIVPLFLLIGVSVVGGWNKLSLSRTQIVLSLIIILLCVSDEVWRFHTTGIFLASNQDFFDYAVGQPPGTLDAVSFLSFQFFELLRSPFLSDTTLHSFSTELFARTWFDYERRFFPATATVELAGALIYILALPVTIAMIGAVGFSSIYSRRSASTIILLVILILFLAVPILQTLRFPYYSSMKAVFYTPAISAIACLAYQGATRLNGTKNKRNAILIFLILCLLIISSLTTLTLLFTSSQAWLNGVSGPMWPLPPL